MTTANRHNIHSSEREEYVEYIVLGALCSWGWSRGRLVEVSRTKTDAFGYDVVLSSGGVTRHVQLKASVAGGTTRDQKVNSALARREGGCVLWIRVDADTLMPVDYGWFGGAPGQPMPDLGDKVARHSKGDATGEKKLRPGIRVVPWSRFVKLQTAGEVFACLFGEEGI